MYIKKYLSMGMILVSTVHASDALPAVSENVRISSSLISDGDAKRNGEPVANYKQAIALLTRQGQMRPNEMLLLAKAYVGIGNALQATEPALSQEHFRRAMVMLEQIPQQVKRDLDRGVSQAEAKQDEFALAETVSVLQQAKNGLPPIG